MQQGQHLQLLFRRRSKLQELRAAGCLSAAEARQLRMFEMPRPDATPVTQALIGWGKAAALHMTSAFKVSVGRPSLAGRLRCLENG